ncbi:hypothetical protein AOQ84DRAFT_125511 [Glonium stellatum]|uniref:Uncharacterized protein n=1 Tax=Glonium stellatum TaxID=574774 RepID=A0A8E2ET13_9PEZI|nr:hypothetical protein AOQ84DRAFT_125511 [Glonium stellatum]
MTQNTRGRSNQTTDVEDESEIIGIQHDEDRPTQCLLSESGRVDAPEVTAHGSPNPKTYVQSGLDIPGIRRDQDHLTRYLRLPSRCVDADVVKAILGALRTSRTADPAGSTTFSCPPNRQPHSSVQAKAGSTASDCSGYDEIETLTNENTSTTNEAYMYIGAWCDEKKGRSRTIKRQGR